ncbi:hypothetical protein KIW84_023925 [Lathyrus oleraceus]|uniref:Uncharacterized protein n=1 Tax=Pisum sativum TaxID=3888 RepID=A0A9D5B736_PEA|nr:hypothetical protein KIW84_023925 [Pisum sativum]
MLRDVYQIPSRRVHVILNVVDEEDFKEYVELGKEFRTKIGIPSNASLGFGVVGILVKDKGHPLLHEAFSRLIIKHTNMLRPQGLDLTLMKAMMIEKPLLASRFPSIKGPNNSDVTATATTNMTHEVKPISAVSISSAMALSDEAIKTNVSSAAKDVVGHELVSLRRAKNQGKLSVKTVGNDSGLQDRFSKDVKSYHVLYEALRKVYKDMKVIMLPFSEDMIPCKEVAKASFAKRRKKVFGKLIRSSSSISLELGVPLLVPTPLESWSWKKCVWIVSTAPDKDWETRSKRVKVDSVVGVARKEGSASLCLPYVLAGLSS